MTDVKLGYLIIISFLSSMLFACSGAKIQEISSTIKPSNTVSTTPSKTSTSSPTITITITPSPSSTQTKTPTSTLTPTNTPIPTPIGGGSGKIIGSCRDEMSSIYTYDLANGEYQRPNDFPHTTEHWIADQIFDISPAGDRIIWYRSEYKDFTFSEEGWIEDPGFYHHETLISNIDFSDPKPYFAESPPYAWFTNDKFVELKLHIVGNDLVSVDMFLVDLVKQTRNKFNLPYEYMGLQGGLLSPDGKYMAFSGSLGDIDFSKEMGAIYFLDMESLEGEWDLTQIPSNTVTVTHTAWSPDGSSFLYYGWYIDEPTGTHLWGTYTIEIDSLWPRHLGDFFATWSPDPQILIKHDPVENDFVLMSPYGKIIKRLKNDVHFIEIDHIFPYADGSGFFISTHSDKYPRVGRTTSLFSYDMDTERLADLMVEEVLIEFKPSPDGKWLLVTSSGRDEEDKTTSNTFICSQENCSQFKPPNTGECKPIFWLKEAVTQ